MSDAQYYQRHKDDEGEWGEPVRMPASARRRLASMISVRFSAEEARWVRKAAADAGESVSNYIRTATLRRSLRTVPTPTVSGASIMWDNRPLVSGNATRPSDEADWQPDESLLEASSTRLAASSTGH
jgi:hypothetical protein